MTDPPRVTSSIVVEADFREPDKAARIASMLVTEFVASGARYTPDKFLPALEALLASSSDPDMVLTNLSRFVDASASKATFFNDLVEYPVWFEVLVLLFGSSQYFADILVRDPELFRWLTATDVLHRFPTKEILGRETLRTGEAFRGAERRLNALRRMLRRETLRIGARDLLGTSNLEEVTRAISMLADVLIDAVVAISMDQLKDRFPDGPQVGFVVIGLGKLGGNELNYSSDIDILFVYEDEIDFHDASGRTVTAHEYFNLLSERIVQNLSDNSVEGHLYRVDTRLRPESGAGPLARSLASMVTYYESRGEIWERQMLIKARPVGGDLGLGQRLLDQLEPFVYPRTFFSDPVESVARIKARIEASIAGEDNIKLQPGGIRDIEFIIQVLQLLNGGREERVRSGNSLQALDRLKACGLIADVEEEHLRTAYIFFRTMEHRLQMVFNAQTHAFPSDPHNQRALAQRMGLASTEELQSRRANLRAHVRRIFDTIVATKTKGSLNGIEAVIDGGAGDDALGQFLGERGFTDTRQATRNLRTLISGTPVAGKRDFDARIRDAFRGVADELFRDMLRTVSPDRTLQNIAHLVGAQPFPQQFYEQLREKNFRSLILRLASSSPRLIKSLAAHPVLMDRLAIDAELTQWPEDDPATAMLDPFRFKVREELRQGVQFVLGMISIDELLRGLSDLAGTIVAGAFQQEVAAMGMTNPPLAIVAMGKFGSRELTFDADLDLIFVAKEGAVARNDKLEKLAQAVIARLSQFTAEGKLYDVDARLRPEGKNSPLVVDLDAYRHYLNERASLWERQSLTRMRFCCGNEHTGRAVLEMVTQWLYEAPLPKGWIRDVVAMRKKTEARSRAFSRDFYDIKLGQGGMVDIEFLAQIFQLAFGRARSDLRSGKTAEIIQKVVMQDLVPNATISLMHAYSMYRKIETFMRIALEERSTILPEGEKLAYLGKVLRGWSGDQLLAYVSRTTREVREIFLQVCRDLSPE